MTASISFCTTCRNRLWQLKETLPINLKAIKHEHEVVVVDYGSTDGLSDWIWQNFKSEIADKRLVFFEVKNEVRWNVARAKNLAHRLASGDYLFNLDADNFITPRDIQLIEKAKALRVHSHQWSGVWEDGSFGRIGAPADIYKEIGGYDDTLLPMGGQDIDLITRLSKVIPRMANLKAPQLPAIKNSLAEKVKELMTSASEAEVSEEIYKEMNSLSLNISKYRLQTEGAVRVGGGFSYKGLLNGEGVTINGFDEIHPEPNIFRYV